MNIYYTWRIIKKVFKSRASITNTLRLLQLNSYVQQLLATEKISAGHAKLWLDLQMMNKKMILLIQLLDKNFQ